MVKQLRAGKFHSADRRKVRGPNGENFRRLRHATSEYNFRNLSEKAPRFGKRAGNGIVSGQQCVGRLARKAAHEFDTILPARS